MADIQALINEFNGSTEKVGDTDVNRGECVGLVEVWLDRLGAPHIWGNACDLANNADRNAYDVIPNTPEFVPVPGDIGVLPAGWGGSDVGHTFIVAPGTNVNTLVAFEQNDRIGGGDGRCRIFDHIGWPDGLVFIHPHALNAPAPAAPVDPSPEPTPEPVAPAPVSAPAPSPEPAPVVGSVIASEPVPEPVPGPGVAEDTHNTPVVGDASSDASSDAPVNSKGENNQPDQTPVSTLKPGYKTTEFWVSLALLALPFVNLWLGAHISADVATTFIMTLASAVAAMVGPVSYIVGRLSLKGAK